MRKDADYIIKKSIAAVLPDEAVKKAIKPGKYYLVAVGKAAWQMANAAAEIVDIIQGVVITKYGYVKGKIENCECYEAGHPISDENSINATQAAIKLVNNLTATDKVLFLLSGGGSSLFEDPKVSLEELRKINKELIASGACITEINKVRKSLSKVKGNKFAKICAPAKVYSIILSDIVGNPADMIASGPAYSDGTNNVETIVKGSVKELCKAAADAAEELGYTPILLTDELTCEAKDAGSFLGSIGKTYADSDKSLAFIAGGETVVHLTGKGKGGRNQELALAASEKIAGLNNVAIFSVGSDGTDGPTDAAGGYVDAETYQKTDVDKYLNNNDAYNALKKTGGLIITGPTGTNVNDVSVVLIKNTA